MMSIYLPVSFLLFRNNFHNVFKFKSTLNSGILGTNFKFHFKNFSRHDGGDRNYISDEDNDHFLNDDFDQQDLIDDIFRYDRLTELSSKNVFVIMPRQKRGTLKKTHDRAELLLNETITLVESIPNFSVTGAQIISTSSIESEKIFGSTNLKQLKENVKQENADAVVFSLDVLKPNQHHFFQTFLNAEIYDRFSIVLKIFRERCSTKEAKLQLALAELDYVKKNLHHMKECDFEKFSISQSFGGNFDTFYQIKKQIIQERENRLKKALSSISNNYELKRQNRSRLEIPSVAVVGYTNSGKTSLIKALTHDSSLTPEDKLFATLDVTTHELTLPSNLKALLIDTIGFISNIPTTLLHCFRSTLKEICSADLIVHVVDASHPDKDLQIETVNQTLKEIEVPEKLLENMIEVSNKIDKIQQVNDCIGIPISATQRINLDQLAQKIELGIIQNTDRLALEIKVPNGGEKYQWLYRETSIVDCIPDDNDANLMIMKVIMTKSKFGKFYKTFLKNDNNDDDNNKGTKS